MDFFIDIFLHIDQHLITLVQEYHEWTYALLFLIIFCETGLVVTPLSARRLPSVCLRCSGIPSGDATGNKPADDGYFHRSRAW